MPKHARTDLGEARRQRNFYDGKQAGFVPVYQHAGSFRKLMQEQVESARRFGMLGCSLKALRNRRELDRLGLKPGQRVLDAGSGGGLLLNQLLARYGVDGWGVDIAPLAVRRARECGDPRLHYRVAPLERLPFKDATFDAVVSFDVLEHVQDKVAVLKELMRVLKPGGRFLFYAVSKRDVLTWHWCLRAVSKGRWGRDDEAGHVHDLFLDPGETRRRLEGLGARGLSLGYLHSFFSLAVDEALVWVAKRRVQGLPAVGRWRRAALPVGESPGRSAVPAVKRWTFRFLAILAPVVEGLELPWKLLGLGNGFFVRGRNKDATEDILLRRKP